MVIGGDGGCLNGYTVGGRCVDDVGGSSGECLKGVGRYGR